MVLVMNIDMTMLLLWKPCRDVKAGNVLIGEDGSVQLAGVYLRMAVSTSLFNPKSRELATH